MQNLIEWVCLPEQIKTNNNTIRNLTGEYTKIGLDCREEVRAQLEYMKQLCKERSNMYEKKRFERAEIQNRKIVESIKNVGAAVAMPYVLVVNME